MASRVRWGRVLAVALLLLYTVDGIDMQRGRRRRKPSARRTRRLAPRRVTHAVRRRSSPSSFSKEVEKELKATNPTSTKTPGYFSTIYLPQEPIRSKCKPKTWTASERKTNMCPPRHPRVVGNNGLPIVCNKAQYDANAKRNPGPAWTPAIGAHMCKGALKSYIAGFKPDVAQQSMCRVHEVLEHCPNDRYRALVIQRSLSMKNRPFARSQYAYKYWQSLGSVISSKGARLASPFALINGKNSMACWLTYIRGKEYDEWLSQFSGEAGSKVLSDLIDCVGEELFICKELGEMMTKAWVNLMTSPTQMVRKYLLGALRVIGHIGDAQAGSLVGTGKFKDALVGKVRGFVAAKVVYAVWDKILAYVESKPMAQADGYMDIWTQVVRADPTSLSSVLQMADANTRAFQKEQGLPETGILPSGWTLDSTCARCAALFRQRCQCYAETPVDALRAYKDQACQYMSYTHTLLFKRDYPKEGADLSSYMTFINAASEGKAAFAHIKKWASKLKVKTDTRIMVAGFASTPEPRKGHNLALSARRAQLVTNMLSNEGVSLKQLSSRKQLPSQTCAKVAPFTVKVGVRRQRKVSVEHGVFKCGHQYATSDRARSRKVEVHFLEDH